MAWSATARSASSARSSFSNSSVRFCSASSSCDLASSQRHGLLLLGEEKVTPLAQLLVDLPEPVALAFRHLGQVLAVMHPELGEAGSTRLAYRSPST